MSPQIDALDKGSPSGQVHPHELRAWRTDKVSRQRNPPSGLREPAGLDSGLPGEHELALSGTPAAGHLWCSDQLLNRRKWPGFKERFHSCVLWYGLTPCFPLRALRQQLPSRLGDLGQSEQHQPR